MLRRNTTLRSGARALSLAACLALVGVQALPTATAPAESVASAATAEDVRGAGWKAFAACVGCIVGGITIATGGLVSILAAAAVPGSTLALGGCIAACATL